MDDFSYCLILSKTTSNKWSISPAPEGDDVYSEKRRGIPNENASVQLPIRRSSGGKDSTTSSKNGGPGFSHSNVVGCFSADGTFVEPNVPSANTPQADGCNNSCRSESLRQEWETCAVQRERASLDCLGKRTAPQTPWPFRRSSRGPTRAGTIRGAWWTDGGCSLCPYKIRPNSSHDAVVGWGSRYLRSVLRSYCYAFGGLLE